MICFFGDKETEKVFNRERTRKLSPEMWLRLQARYELEKAQDEADPEMANRINPLV